MSQKASDKQYFAKHPLAQRIMKEVEAWSENGYALQGRRNITPVTRELLEYWFNIEIHESARFHLSQRRAIETVVYCYEVLGAPTPGELFNLFDGEQIRGKGIEKELEKMTFPRFAVKMATGTGKTWVINALIVIPWGCTVQIKNYIINLPKLYLVKVNELALIVTKILYYEWVCPLIYQT